MTGGTAWNARPRPARAWLVLLPAWLACLAFLAAFADRDGYEGDDLNSILPMAHLDAARQGLLLIYRYAWQPLSYETGAAVWRAFGTPDAVFLTAPAAGATTLALLLWWLWREGRSPPLPALAAALVALLGIPELGYSALYFNSTILGMPLLAGALLLARGAGGLGHALAAGVLAGLAILMRMDFILVCPLLAMAAWPRGASLARPVAVAAGVVAALLAGWAAGLLDLAGIMRIQAESTAEIRDRATEPGWDLRTRLFVASIALSPAGWLMLIGGGGLLLAEAARRRDWRAAGWLLAALPAAYPLPSMLSPKYLLPAAPFLLLLFVRAQERLAGRRAGPVRAGLAVLAAAPLLVSVSLSGTPPFLKPGLAPARPVETHDGPRGYGGYLWQMAATDAPAQRTGSQRRAHALARELLDGRPQRVLLLGGQNVFDPGGMGWRHLQLILERRGIRGTLIAPHALLFELGEGRRLILAREAPPMATAGYRIIDLRAPGGDGG